MLFIPKDKKGIERCHCREKNTSTFLFHGYNSMPYTYNTIPYEKVNNLLRLFFSYRSFSGIHRKITKGCLDFINAILRWYQLCRHSHKADAAILLLYGVLSKRSSYDDVALGVINHTIYCAGWCLLHLLGYALYGICHIGIVTLCKTGCGGSYYHHQRNHNLLHILLHIKRVILHFPRSTNHSILSFPDYERKSKKIISISQISKPTLYEMPFCMYQMTKM